MARPLRRLLNQPRFFVLKRGLLFGRGLLFLGRAHRCPVCRWPLRAFVTRWSLTETSPDGYCPRCNSKARHRRDWRFLLARTALGAPPLTGAPLRILEVAPVWALARRLRRIPGVDHTGLDRQHVGPHTDLRADVTEIPVEDNHYDGILCIHVLEHVADDARAMAELHRVLRPGGWALVTAPVDPSRPTDEDPTLADPAARAQRFGEPDHVRAYGLDLGDRLAAAGFTVAHADPAALGDEEVRRWGLRRDEHVFFCRKPPS